MNGVDETLELQNTLNAKVDTGIPDQQLEALYFAKTNASNNRLSWGYCSDLAERIIGRSQKFTSNDWDQLAVAVQELDFSEVAAETVGGTIAANCTLRAFNAILNWDMFKYANLRKSIEERYCTEKNLAIMQSDPKYYGAPSIDYVDRFIRARNAGAFEHRDVDLSRGACAYERRHGHHFNPPS